MIQNKKTAIACWIVFGVMLFACSLPETLVIEERVTIQTSASSVYQKINNLKQWPEWCPWVSMEGDVSYAFSEQAEGKGAIIQWESKSEYAVKGEVEVVEETLDEEVKVHTLFAGIGQEGESSFKIKSATNSTCVEVIWEHKIPLGYNLFLRLFGLFYGRALHNEFQKGLINLKAVCEERYNSNVTVIVN